MNQAEQEQKNEKTQQKVGDACDVLTELYDHAMSTELKSKLLNAVVSPMREYHKNKVYASVIICGSLKDRLKSCLEQEIGQEFADAFPVAGSTMFGTPLVWENSAEFGLKVIFENGDSSVVEAAD